MDEQMDTTASKGKTCLDPYIESFEDRLRERNYTTGTIKTYRVLVRRLAEMMEAQGVTPSRLSTDVGG